MRKIKLLFFHFDMGNGGAERVLVNLANSLDQSKYDIEIRTIFNDGPNRNLISPWVKYTSVFNRLKFRGISPLLQLFPPRLLHKVFIRGEYDIEIAFREGCPSRIISGCRNSGTRTYSWIHTTLSSDDIAARGYLNLKDFVECCKRFKGIATVSEVVRENVIKWLPKELRVQTVYNVINPDEIRTLAREPIDKNLDEKVVNIVTVGRLTQVKSYDRLLNSLAGLNKSGVTNWHLYIIGVGELEQKLKDYAEREDLGTKVSFLGFQKNPHKYVSRMDLYVCTSLIEGYSTAVVESIINGTPVLTTECAGMKEIIGESEAGMIVPNNEHELTEGLRKLISNPDLLAEMRKSAKKRSNFFSKENSIRQFEEFISK